jgi:hypothetical protein
MIQNSTTNKIYTVLLLLCSIIVCAPNFSNGQTYTYRVFFKDKGPENFTETSSIYRKTLAIHNQRCLERRSKVLAANQQISLQDAPLYQPYLQGLALLQADVILQLRWNNYAVARCDSTIADAIALLPFVKRIKRTATKLQALSTANTLHQAQYLVHTPISGSILEATTSCGVLRYGNSFNQAQINGIPELHAMGIMGEGTLTGFLDTGFRWKFHESTKNANVLNEYDFINRDSVTGNEGGDVGSQDNHGSIVFSTVCGFQQDSLIGFAPHAQFLLAKTEDIPTEQHLEEDNYAAAVEWEEAQGADIISSSLGYSNFNQPDEENYSFADFDGKTTITAIAVNNAVRRGVVCISAAGNDGPRDSTLITPSDADSVIAVAAVAQDGLTPATFTSRGPRGDGKIKPDIAAQGVSVVCSSVNDTLVLGAASGTSLATPLIAGTATLFLSVFPELRPWEVKKYLFETASNSDVKNDTLGFGVANLPAAMMKAGTIISPAVPTYPIKDRQRVVVFIRSAAPILKPKITVQFTNEAVEYPLFPTDKPYQFAADLPLSRFAGIDAHAFVTVDDGTTTRRMPYKPNTSFVIGPNSSIFPCGIDPDSLPYSPDTIMSVETTPAFAELRHNEASLTMFLNVESDISIKIYSIVGQMVYALDSHSRSRGLNTLTVPIANYPVGTYFVVAQYQGKTQFARFLKY